MRGYQKHLQGWFLEGRSCRFFVVVHVLRLAEQGWRVVIGNGGLEC
jgi:hypothetical protein